MGQEMLDQHEIAREILSALHMVNSGEALSKRRRKEGGCWK
jgi:hypothetical protein